MLEKPDSERVARQSNARGNFQFAKGTTFYASAVIADRGFEVVRAVLKNAIPLQAGFGLIQDELKNRGRPVQALCGMELRAPSPYPSRQSFMDFNTAYVDYLRKLDLLVDGLVPITRANLAVTDALVQEQCLYAFSYTVPSTQRYTTFMTSAFADVYRSPDGSVIHLPPDTPFEKRLSVVIEALDRKLQEIEVSWDLATQMRIYTIHPIGIPVEQLTLPAARLGMRHGLNWHYSRPPVEDFQVEVDVRSISQEIMLGS